MQLLYMQVSNSRWYARVVVSAKFIAYIVHLIPKLVLTMLVTGFFVALTALFPGTESVDDAGKNSHVTKDARPK